MSGVRELQLASADAAALVANFRSIIGDDDQATHDLIEGETNLLAVLDGAVARLAEIEAIRSGIAELVGNLAVRSDRLKKQGENIRAALQHALETANLKKHESPAGTISLRAVAPSATITEEADIPSRFWITQPPKLDRKAVLAALKDKIDVPGATLSNGGQTIAIKLG